MVEEEDAYKYPWSPTPTFTLCVILGNLLASLSLSFLFCEVKVKWEPTPITLLGI